MILLELTRCFQGVLVDQGSLKGSRRGIVSENHRVTFGDIFKTFGSFVQRI
jgi:hypothetical protein